MRILCVLLAGAALWGAAPAEAPAAKAAPAAVPADPPSPPAAPVALSPLEQVQVDAIKFVEAQAAALTGAYMFRVVRPPILPRVPEGGKLTFEAMRLSRKDLGGMFFATCQARVDGRPAGLVRVDIEGTWTGQLLRARAALAHWTVPEAEQFEQVDFQGNPPPGALSGIPAGYRLRAPVGAGHLLAMQDLETIPVVSPGEDVRLDLVSGPLTITIAATARSGGAVGDKIRLEMPTSHKIVQAVVTGPDAARVQWAGGN